MQQTAGVRTEGLGGKRRLVRESGKGLRRSAEIFEPYSRGD